MIKDKEAERWLKKHARDLPPEELPEERAGGKRVYQISPHVERVPDPKLHPWGGGDMGEAEHRRFYEAENPGQKYDDLLDAIDQDANFRESTLSRNDSVILNQLRSGFSQADIARKLGVSRAAVTKACIRIRGTMGVYVESIFEPKAYSNFGQQQSQQLHTLKPRGRKKDHSG